MGRKLGGSAPPPFWEGERGAGSSSNAMSLGPRLNSIPIAILIHPAVWSHRTWAENWGLRSPFWGGSWIPIQLRPNLGTGAGSLFNTKSPGPRPTSIPSGILIHPAIWPQQIWAENWGGAVPLWVRGAESPSNTAWTGPRPTRLPSFILIHPTVWPQCTNVTDRTDRAERQTGQRSDSIGRTVLKRSPKSVKRMWCIVSTVVSKLKNC